MTAINFSGTYFSDSYSSGTMTVSLTGTLDKALDLDYNSGGLNLSVNGTNNRAEIKSDKALFISAQGTGYATMGNYDVTIKAGDNAGGAGGDIQLIAGDGSGNSNGRIVITRFAGGSDVYEAIVVDEDSIHIKEPIGYFGASPVARQTVSGSKGGNAALGSLISALATFGLITDSTS